MPSRCVLSVARSRAEAFTDCFLTVASLVLGRPGRKGGMEEGARSSRRVPRGATRAHAGLDRAPTRYNN